MKMTAFALRRERTVQSPADDPAHRRAHGPQRAQVQLLTFETTSAENRRQTRASWDWREVAGSAVVLAGIAGVSLYSRG